MHQGKPLAALPEAGDEVLADEMRVGDVVDDAHRVVAVGLQRRHQLVDRRQERERHVLHPQRRAGRFGDRAQPVERGEEMPDQLLGGGGKQRFALPGPITTPSAPRSPASRTVSIRRPSE